MNVTDRLKNIITDQLGCDDSAVTPDADMRSDLGMDSLDTVELIMPVEEEFEIEIPDDEAEELATLAQAAAYIERRLAE